MKHYDNKILADWDKNWINSSCEINKTYHQTQNNLIQNLKTPPSIN